MSLDGADGAPVEEFPWHLGVYDAHCHPTDIMASLDQIPSMRARVLTIMATRLQDQELVMKANDRLGMSPSDLLAATAGASGWKDRARIPSKQEHYRWAITPDPVEDGFIDTLPDPRPLSVYLEQMKEYLTKCSWAMVGEVGLDKSFRIPETADSQRFREPEPGLTPGSRDGQKLSAYRVEMKHQQAILQAQLKLAGEMGRAVSVHGVAAHGILFETLRQSWKGYELAIPSRRERKRRLSVDNAHAHEEDGAEILPVARESKPFPPRICLHSYSGPPQTLKQYLHPSVPAIMYFSFSKVINFSTSASEKALEVIKALPSDRILVESDLHRAGMQMDEMLEDIVRIICHARNWSLNEGVEQLGKNWRSFAFG